MKESRSIKELLIVLRDNENLFYEEGCNGLCYLILLLVNVDMISFTEMIRLNAYINENAPKLKYQFSDFSTTKRGSSFRWELRAWTPRLKWLNKQIKKL